METIKLSWGTVDPWAIVVACTYMASYVKFRAKTFKEGSFMSGVPSAPVYDITYRFREQIIR